MEFNVDNGLIVETVEIISNVISNKNANPALTGIMLRCNEGKVVLVGYDGNAAIKKVLTDIEIVEEGKCLISCAMLKSILTKFKNQTTNFKKNNNILEVKNGRSTYKINLIDDTTYPNIEFKKLDNELVINNDEMLDILSTTSVACAVANKKPILTGVNFKMEGKQLSAVATDSFRLAKVIKNFDDLEQDYNFNFTIPNNAIKTLIKISNKVDTPNISLLWNNNTNDILFKIKDILFKTRMMDGVYPEISKIINFNYRQLIKVSKKALLESLDRICVLDSGKDLARHIASLKQDSEKDLLLNSISNEGTCIEYIENYEIVNDYDEQMKIVFSAENLIEALKTFETDDVEIMINTDARPMLIVDDTRNKIQLILPIKPEN